MFLVQTDLNIGFEDLLGCIRDGKGQIKHELISWAILYPELTKLVQFCEM